MAFYLVFAKHHRIRLAAMCFSFVNETFSEREIATNEKNQLSTAEIALKILYHKSNLFYARILRTYEQELAFPLFSEAIHCFVSDKVLQNLEKVKLYKIVILSVFQLIRTVDFVSMCKFCVEFHANSFRPMYSVPTEKSEGDKNEKEKKSTESVVAQLLVSCLNEVAGILCERDPSLKGLAYYLLAGVVAREEHLYDV